MADGISTRLIATHSGIISSFRSTDPRRFCFTPKGMLLYRVNRSEEDLHLWLRLYALAPIIVGAKILDQ